MFLVDKEWMLTPFRLAVHVPTKTAVIADPHLGYSDARRRAGDAVPDMPLEEQLAPLHSACVVYDLTGLVVAGDLCESRVDADLARRFAAFVQGCGLVLRAVIPGNHDRGWTGVADLLPFVRDGVALGGWTVVHGDRAWPSGRAVMGHFHPAWRMTGGVRPCYLIGAGKLVLPAFSTDAAGGAVNLSTRWGGYQALVIDGDHVLDRGRIHTNDSRRMTGAPRTPSRRK